jgi:ribosomal protein RSM22 (predicted rRNA methylase)
MRMPATFCAVTVALKNTLNIEESCEIETVLDIGAGTGAATWAINEYINPKEITCLEREEAMRTVGQALMKCNSEMKKVKWISEDITNSQYFKGADLIVASYIINELKQEERKNVIKKLLDLESKIILIIEPGTPEGFKNIKEIQKIALENGRFIIAPCTTQGVCKLPESDWCHSTVRVERNKTHKILKSADAPYEDEKFSYIAISKENLGTAESRILRHPMIENGKITLKLCTNGNIEEKIITKKEKEKFKQAKKKKCGDTI